MSDIFYWLHPAAAYVHWVLSFICIIFYSWSLIWSNVNKPLWLASHLLHRFRNQLRVIGVNVTRNWFSLHDWVQVSHLQIIAWFYFFHLAPFCRSQGLITLMVVFQTNQTWRLIVSPLYSRIVLYNYQLNYTVYRWHLCSFHKSITKKI